MPERLRAEIEAMAIAAMTLSRLPVPLTVTRFEIAAPRAVRYFPVIGLVIGAVCAVVFYAASFVLGPVISAILAIAAGIRLTGALHEDGLADIADGLGGGRTRERALEIMRDSRIGAFGTVALVLMLALQIAALGGMGAGDGALALLTAHGVSRGVLALVLWRGTYARDDGAAGPFGRVSIMDAAVALTIAGGTAMLVLGVAVGTALTVAASAFAMMALASVTRRLGGYTGDALGAIQQCVFAGTLVVLSGLVGS